MENTDRKDVVKEVEEMYPETTKLFKAILREEYELFCLKQSNYGPDNISLGTIRRMRVMI